MSISGKYMIATVGDTLVHGNYAWTIEETADELDATTAEDGGYENPDDGVWSSTVNLKGYMNIIDGTYTPVRRGTLITDLRLYRNIDDAEPAFAIPLAKVFTSTQGGEVKGKIEWTAKIKTKGIYEYADPS